MTDMNIIDIKNVSKEFDGATVVDRLNLYIRKGEFVTLLGPSGCGKTTTLRMIAGFEKPTSGDIYLKGQKIDDIPPHLRPVNTVFQKYALFPTMNVYNNIAFGLKLKRMEVPETDKNGNPVLGRTGKQKIKQVKLEKSVIDQKVRNALKMVGLTDYESRDVNSLSGGQQQRVAIARAIVNEPEVLLLDEPLGALDLKMRKDMQMELKEMHDKLGITFLYVTHDQEEALTMSDTVVVMKDGVIQQIGTPADIYNEPKNAFVANFIGESNILNGVMKKDCLVEFDGTEFECVDTGFEENEPVDVVIRPEDFYIMDVNKSGHLAGVVTSTTFKGMHYDIWVSTKSGCEYLVQDTYEWKEGEEVSLFIKPFDIHIMKKRARANTFEGVIPENGIVEVAGGSFPCNTYQLFPDAAIDEAGSMTDETGAPIEISGRKVRVEIPFDKVELTDDEENGTVKGQIVSLMFKGTHNFVEVKAEDGAHFYVATQDVWDDGDRVGVTVRPEDFRLTLLAEEQEA